MERPLDLEEFKTQLYPVIEEAIIRVLQYMDDLRSTLPGKNFEDQRLIHRQVDSFWQVWNLLKKLQITIDHIFISEFD
jgi:hypothetical protein